MPAAAMVRPPRNGPIIRQRSPAYKPGANVWAIDDATILIRMRSRRTEVEVSMQRAAYLLAHCRRKSGLRGRKYLHCLAQRRNFHRVGMGSGPACVAGDRPP